jgi:hypothetical protein
MRISSMTVSRLVYPHIRAVHSNLMSCLFVLEGGRYASKELKDPLGNTVVTRSMWIGWGLIAQGSATPKEAGQSVENILPDMIAGISAASRTASQTG